MYLLAVFLPPVAVLLCGKPFQAVLCLFLTAFGWLPGIIHAVLVVNQRNEERRHRELLAVMGGRRR